MQSLTPEQRRVELRFADGDRVKVDELHAIFSCFPIVGYRFDQRGGRTQIDVSAAAGVEPEVVRERVCAIVEPQFPGATVRVLAGEHASDTVELLADPPNLVRVAWVGNAAAAAAADARPALALSRDAGDLRVDGDDAAAVDAIVAALSGRPAAVQGITVRGLQPESSGRLLAVRARGPGDDGPIHVDRTACDGCGKCADLCPTRCIDLSSGVPTIDAGACVRCHLCTEFCPTGALRPFDNDDAIACGPLLERLLRTPQERSVSTEYASLPARAERPTVALGLATVTLMEHAAALLVDGELVAAVEEERLVRERHYTYRAEGRHGASLASDPTLPLDASWPRHAMDFVLKMAGMTLDDVDVIGLNGMPFRLRHSFDGNGNPAPRVLQSGRLVFVPHHLCHALSAYGMSEFDRASILTIDGRGDFETLAWWRADGDEVTLEHAVPFFPDRSFGGVFDTITRFLGFGSHGQGSTMALAALGAAEMDMSGCMALVEGQVTLSEWETMHRFRHLARDRDEPIGPEHRALAASLQTALEDTVIGYLRERIGEESPDPLCIAGGVGLSCRMNGVIRRTLRPADMLAPPGANDAGTAIGAALAAHRSLTGRLPRIDGTHTYWGPGWADESVARQLERYRIPFTRLDDVGAQTAELLADGAIVCWFQGRMEFGPRALGGRSILADPRRMELKSRLNRMKSRQEWRPFGPSILAGHQADWFEDDWDSRFMLFAVDVRPEKRPLVPVVVHDDGSTRPQVVHAETNPRYYALIDAFRERTGVPMVTNTSFNRGGEPIVMTVREALQSFAGLGADALVVGDCLVTRDDLRARR